MGFLVRYRIEFEQEELELLGEALDTVPYGKAHKLITLIQDQITRQDADAIAGPSVEPERQASPEKVD